MKKESAPASSSLSREEEEAFNRAEDLADKRGISIADARGAQVWSSEQGVKVENKKERRSARVRKLGSHPVRQLSRGLSDAAKEEIAKFRASQDQRRLDGAKSESERIQELALQRARDEKAKKAARGLGKTTSQTSPVQFSI